MGPFQESGNAVGRTGSTHDAGAEADLPRQAAALQAALAAGGFRVLQPFCCGWYNALLDAGDLPLLRLPTFGRADGRCLGFLVGNTKEAWPFFKRWLHSHGEKWATIADPLDTYTQLIVRQAVAGAFPPDLQTDIFWSAEYNGRLVCMQRLAEVSGGAFLDKVAHLNVHPTYGPWVSWRAAVVVNCCPSALGLPVTPPPSVPCPTSQSARDTAYVLAIAASQAFKGGLNLLSPTTDPRTGLETTVWKLCLAARDALEVEHAWRFPEDEIEYHYTKRAAILAPP
eukprot:GGOE01061245.1.p1 GENE.GGOE01061245.1~~GGOE01061245.1.p1  ORF type:complete len:283 (-),score=57.24 GGOE01061245.1:76-924(-)